MNKNKPTPEEAELQLKFLKVLGKFILKASVVIVIILILIGIFTNPTKEIKYSIINKIASGTKLSYDVRIDTKATKEELEVIANKLKIGDKYKRTFIVYYLPCMKVDSGGYASSHFTPDLEITIYGDDFNKSCNKKLNKEELGLNKNSIVTLESNNSMTICSNLVKSTFEANGNYAKYDDDIFTTGRRAYDMKSWGVSFIFNIGNAKGKAFCSFVKETKYKNTVSYSADNYLNFDLIKKANVIVNGKKYIVLDR